MHPVSTAQLALLDEESGTIKVEVSCISWTIPDFRSLSTSGMYESQRFTAGSVAPHFIWRLVLWPDGQHKKHKGYLALALIKSEGTMTRGIQFYCRASVLNNGRLYPSDPPTARIARVGPTCWDRLVERAEVLDKGLAPSGEITIHVEFWGYSYPRDCPHST